MRIRYLLVVGLALTVSLVTARLVILEVHGREAQQQDQLQLQVSLIARDAASLLVLGQDYLLHHNTRASRQWRAVHAELSHTLPLVLQGSAAYGGDVLGNVTTVRDITAGLPALFEAIESAANTPSRADAQARLDLLADQLVAETRRISDASFELTEQLLEIRKARDIAERRVSQVTISTLLALIMGMGLVVWLRVLRPMAILEATAQAVKQGDLAARSGYRANDEFGSLSRAFDTMTGSLATAQRDLQSILDAVPSMIGYWDQHLVNRFANSAYRLWFGVDPKSLPGQHARALLGEDLYNHNLPFMQAALRGEPQTFERTIPRPEQHGYRHSLAHYVPDVVAGKVIGFYVLVHDVSDLHESRQELAAALRENEALLKAIHLHALVSATDATGHIQDVNSNFCRISGYSREALLGQTHRIIHSGVQQAAFWADMWRTIASGATWRGEICNRAQDGRLYWVDSSITPLLGQDGQVQRYISIHTDITAAKQLELRLRSSEGLLAHASKLAGVGGWEMDVRTQTLTWSAQTRRIHRVPPDYVPQLDTALDFFPPQARQTLEIAVARCVESGVGWDLEVPMATATGEAIWVRAVGEAECEHGKVVKLIGALQDITERKRAAAQLQETNVRFALACDAAGIGVWEFDVLDSSLTWDDWMYRMYGATPAADVEPYALWVDSLHPQDRVRCEQEVAMALAGDQEFDSEFRIVRTDGEVRYLKAAARTRRAADGRATRMTGVNFDITERKRAELRLLETSSLLRTVLDSASEVSIIATDPELRIKVFNAGAEQLLGYTSAEVVGHAKLPFIHDPVELRMRAQVRGEEAMCPLADGGALLDPVSLDQAREWTYVRKDASQVCVSLVVSAMRTQTGELLGYLGVAHDVTQQKQHEQSLREAMQKAEQANQAKSQFLANMSHEIRTPMHAVIGLSYLMGRTRLDTEQAALLGKIKLASKSLLAVINDVLDLSRIEAGELLVEDAPFQPRELLQDLASVMAASAEAKRIHFMLAMDPDVPHQLQGDAARLGQILTNLVSNAIKFTDHGRVALTVYPLPTPFAGSRLCFSVKDTGIGMDAAQQQRLFTPFAQADASITRRYGGTGLGLSIVKRLTGLMGGELQVDSTPAYGSEFRVTLDFALAQAHTFTSGPVRQGPVGAWALWGVHVLVVDDSDINRDVARRILELEGAQVTLAANGQEAVDRLRDGPDGVDLVLMDIQMPVMDGLQATQRIRHELLRTALPIIALTAGALGSERERAFAAEMNDFITKPFDAGQLVQSILRHAAPKPVSGLHLLARSGPATWPDIAGIDAEDVRLRLGNDPLLFRNLLQRFLREFDPLAFPQGEEAADVALADFARRMHKLKGGAGTLGAKAIQQTAERAESACAAGALEELMDLVRLLTVQLQALRDGAAPVLHAGAAELATTVPVAQGAVDRAALRDLVKMLKRQELAATASFHALRASVQALLGPAAYAQALSDIQGLRFREVASVLEAQLL